MKVFIIAENSECNLAPLSERIPHALLPVAGKTLLMHALEDLHRSGFHDVTVIAPRNAERLRKSTDTGPLLGMNIEFSPFAPVISQLGQHVLVIGLREMVDVCWLNTIDQLGDLDLNVRQPVRMNVQGLPVGLLLPPHFEGRIAVDWADVYDADALQISIGPCALLSTGSVAHYYNSSFRVLRGEFQRFRAAGRELTPGHRAGPKAYVQQGSLQTQHAYLGQNCRIDKTATLQGSTIVGENAVIARGARVTDSMVLDGTYLGANTDCRNAIVAGNLLIRVDSGVVLRLDDPVLFSAVA